MVFTLVVPQAHLMLTKLLQNNLQPVALLTKSLEGALKLDVASFKMGYCLFVSVRSVIHLLDLGFVLSDQLQIVTGNVVVIAFQLPERLLMVPHQLVYV